MNGQIFRKKSIERVSSPEQLNEYIKVSNPSMWMVLLAIIILLVGICAWGMIGHLDTTVNTVAFGHNAEMNIYIKEDDRNSVKENMQVKVNGREYVIKAISSKPVMADDSFDEYMLHVGEIDKGEWIYTGRLEGEYVDGIAKADVVIDRVSPIYFVLN